MPEFIDQLNRKVLLNFPPARIVSLVPSQTELLYDLGLRDEVAGITKFCIHPDEWFKTKPRVGGTKKINFEKINTLKPDLIIGNKEENDQSQIEELMKHYPVWMSDVKNLEDALNMILQIGELVNKKNEAIRLSSDIRSGFDNLPGKIRDFTPLHKLETLNIKQSSVAYLIWKDPLITVGADTFIHDMLSKCGFENVFSNQKRYPEITEEDLGTLHPDLILLSSEPFPFKEKHREEFQSRFPDSTVLLVDGELFSWYGSRLLKAPEYFRSLVNQFHPEN
jgi:ABC-type Fe3+-hydroxamate transport system substrate-binding protein